ncbi:MAG: AAA family ATPase [Deltaproteobacteria bacterium]|nr:AAA family ATPase [Deltaproteobacteria bacterium]
MLREYQLTNFKAFAGPETIPIRPITLIYGPNSSGKSSILQSLLLLKQTLEEADSSTVLLPKGKLVDLGDYHEFVHRHEVSKRFSFKALFTLDPEKIDSLWVKKLLKAAASALAGLNVDFVYDEEAKAIRFSSVEVFIGDKVLPAISYPPSVFEEGEVPELRPAIQINREHSFWRSWWNVTKEHFEEELITDSGDVELVSYKGVEYEPFKRVLKDLRNYPFEKAIEDLQNENTFWRIDYHNFLPAGRGSLPAEFLRELKALIEKTEQAQRGQSSSPADSLEKQSTEDRSPFAAEIFYSSIGGQEPFRQGLDVSPVAFQVCSVFLQLIKDMIYLGPLRSYPERLYTSSGNVSDHVGKFGERLPDILFRDRELLNQVN